MLRGLIRKENLTCLSRFLCTAKNQMDIDTLGDKTIAFLFEKGFVKDVPDLYTFDYDKLLDEEGFKEKKIAKIKNSIEKSKEKPFVKVLTALGFDGLGTAAVKDLIADGYYTMEKIIEVAEQGDVETLADIEGFGEIMANLVIRHFTDPQNLALIEALKQQGLNFEAEPLAEPEGDLPFSGQVWVITGSFENFQPRTKAAEEIEKRGGKTAGSKLKKAQKLDITIIEEPEFLKML